MRALALLTLLLLAGPACVSRPERDVVTDVDLYGGPEVDADEALEGMATAETSRFLGIFYRVYEYEIFDENVLTRDLERIERYYRARGYYEARVTAARVLRDEGDVRVEIHVHEGPPVITRSVEISGLEFLPINVSTAALRAMTLQPDRPFDEALFEETKRVIGDTLANNGYAFVQVKSTARVDISQHQAVARYEVTPGPSARYGEVRVVFVGNHEIPEGPVRGNIGIQEGDPYSRQDLRDARAALDRLQVLASVDIQEDTSKPETGVVPITVYVSEAKLRTVRLGGGARYDVLQFENHLRLGWEDRNFLGGLRRFSIDNRPGLIYYPMRFGSSDLPTRAPLVANKLRSQLKQPSFLEGRTTGFVTSEYNIYPLLYPPPENFDPETERIIGYHEVKAQTGIERFFYENHFYVSPSYNWKANFPFTYQRDVPNGLDRVIVSFPEIQGNIDFRDDPIRPHKGFFFSNEVQVAGFIFGGDVSDFRIRPEARLYTPLARDRRWTLALRTTFGFLFPSDYGDTLDPATSQGRSLATNPTDPDVIADQHKLLFRAFYSGGPTSNRGYPFRGVGPHGPIGFLVPTGQDCSRELPDGTFRPVEALPSTCIRPLGGLTLWEASLEVRFPIAGALSGATFADASDVTRSVGEIRFNFPHLSVGPGVRYDTPVGPLRLDIGIRLPFAQQIGEAEPRTDEGPAEPLSVFGLVELPIAVHFAFGEAF